jgi:hypothetical protein
MTNVKAQMSTETQKAKHIITRGTIQFPMIRAAKQFGHLALDIDLKLGFWNLSLHAIKQTKSSTR